MAPRRPRLRKLVRADVCHNRLPTRGRLFTCPKVSRPTARSSRSTSKLAIRGSSPAHSTGRAGVAGRRPTRRRSTPLPPTRRRYAVVAKRAGQRFPRSGAHVRRGRAHRVAWRQGVLIRRLRCARGCGATRQRASDRRAGEAAGCAGSGGVGECSTMLSRLPRRSCARVPAAAAATATAVFAHVVGAETAYARKLGVRQKEPQDPRRDRRGASRHPRGHLGSPRRHAADREGLAAQVRGPPDRLARPRPRLGDRGPQLSVVRVGP